jgi:hypothetical protein
MQENTKYDYLKNILEEEFPDVYWRFHEHGIVETQVQNIMGKCEALFEEMGFDVDDRMLQYAVIGEIHEYLAAQQTLN